MEVTSGIDLKNLQYPKTFRVIVILNIQLLLIIDFAFELDVIIHSRHYCLLDITI